MDDFFGSIFDFVFSVLLARAFYTFPRIRKDNGRLYAETGLKTHLLCLGFGSRRIEIDPQAKVVRIAVRRFWFFTKSRRIEFDWVLGILYDYADLGWGWWGHREIDLFTVSLKLKNGEDVSLFRFSGEGGFVSDSFLPDWWFWEEHLVTPLVAGNQEKASQMFAEVVSGLIGVPVTNPLP